MKRLSHTSAPQSAYLPFLRLFSLRTAVTRLLIVGLMASALGASLLFFGPARAEVAQPAAATTAQDEGGLPEGGLPEIGPNAYLEADKPHRLAGTFYSLRDGLSAVLMLNNKGALPLEVTPTLFSAAGERLDLEPVTIAATSFRHINLREWAARGGPAFEEGSIQLFHKGRDLILGAQIYLTDEARSLSFEEKLSEITSGEGPTRQEAVWWLPSPRAGVRLALSNATDAPLSVTARFASARPGRQGSATLALGPYETRVINPSDYHSGWPHGLGAVTVEHAGGVLLARAMVEDAASGFSTAVQFTAPAKGKSSRFEGAGLRLNGPAGERLDTVVVARNVGAEPVVVTGRVPYAAADGRTGVAEIAAVRLGPGELARVDVARALKQARVPARIESAGLAFEHKGAPGSVLMAAHSMSADGNHVYRVPLWDPLGQRSPTGGYPWYVEGGSSTMVYLKNITEREQQYTANVLYDGGVYSFGLRTVAPGQTVTLDLRALRDGQVPDARGNTIPADVSRGQFKWSLRHTDEVAYEEDPYEALALIGRSEQTDDARGLSNNYACMNCCSDYFLGGYLVPGNIEVDAGQQVQYTAFEAYQDCYGWIHENEVWGASWSSSNTSVATVSGGLVTASNGGDATIKATWNRTVGIATQPCGPIQYLTGEVPTDGGDHGDHGDPAEPVEKPGGDGGVSNIAPCGSCTFRFFSTSASANISVLPRVTINGAQTVMDGDTANFSVTVTNGSASSYAWTFEAPAGSGNNPNVPFNSTTVANPSARAHWFANPNSACGAGGTSTYTIRCQVTFPNGKSKTVSTTLGVNAIWNPAGSVAPPTITGGPTIGFSPAAARWVVVNSGTLARNTSPAVIHVPATSQFHNKTVQHENRHVHQWNAGLLANVYSINSLMNVLFPLTDPTQAGLQQQMNNASLAWFNNETNTYNGLIPAAERDAYNISDPIAPMYVYQNCGRF
jgi:hypothetical protein